MFLLIILSNRREKWPHNLGRFRSHVGQRFTLDAASCPSLLLAMRQASWPVSALRLSQSKVVTRHGTETWDPRNSLRQVHPFQHVLEARLGAQVVKLRLDCILTSGF